MLWVFFVFVLLVHAAGFLCSRAPVAACSIVVLAPVVLVLLMRAVAV